MEPGEVPAGSLIARVGSSAAAEEGSTMVEHPLRVAPIAIGVVALPVCPLSDLFSDVSGSVWV
jgi:hypothetical protein